MLLKEILAFYVPLSLYDDEDEDDPWEVMRKWKEEEDKDSCSKCGGKLKLLDTGFTTKHFYCPKCKT
jgi:hypothetical protein